MSHITIVGLGPGSPEHLTCEALEMLSHAEEVWLRTLHHPVVSSLSIEAELRSFDALYETSETFEQVYEQIVERVLALGQRSGGVIYAVPGHPLVGEATVPSIMEIAREQGVPIRLVAGLSFIEPLLAALEVDALDGLQIFDALDIVKLIYPPIMPDLPALIAQVYSREVASDLKLALMNQYPDEHKVSLVDAAGTSAQTVRSLPLYEIDRQALAVGALTSLYLPPLPSTCSFEGFQETIARLRSPEGCPWDREQTPKSLRKNLLEEAYEVIAAIDAEDQDALREELGDLLLQIVLQTQIAGEYGDFQMPEVITGIDAKLKRRHPHVWGSVQVDGAQDVCRNWEAIKQAERESEGHGQRSLLDGIPKTLPALAQAYAYGSRAANVGVESSNVGEIIERVRAEVEALTLASDLEAQVRKLGELLFAVAEWGRWLSVDPESALREANLRFAQRLQHLEAMAHECKISLQHMEDVDLEHPGQE